MKIDLIVESYLLGEEGKDAESKSLEGMRKTVARLRNEIKLKKGKGSAIPAIRARIEALEKRIHDITDKKDKRKD
jgi:polyhydroxyalkanoate synthesis regulator phasin